MDHWTTPPSSDDSLEWYFCHAESAMGIRSISEAMEAMALAGIQGGGTVQTDDKLVRRGIVGVKTADRGDTDIRLDAERGSRKPLRDRESAAGKYRRIDGYMRQLSRLDYAVLALAYGSSVLTGQAKQIVTGAQFKARVRSEQASAGPSFQERIGAHPAVVLLTSKARSMPLTDFDAWVRAKTTDPAALTRVKLEAREMLRVAWNRFADVRGRRSKRAERHKSERDMFAAAQTSPGDHSCR